MLKLFITRYKPIVEQVAVTLQPVLIDDSCTLCMDELTLFQLTHILADGVLTHTHCPADVLAAKPALVIEMVPKNIIA